LISSSNIGGMEIARHRKKNRTRNNRNSRNFHDGFQNAPFRSPVFNLGKYVSATTVSKAEGGSIVVESYATRAMEKDFPEQPKTAVIPRAPVTTGIQFWKCPRQPRSIRQET